MTVDPRKRGDYYDKLAKAEAAKVQTGDTQARLAKLLDERDRWYALADREDAKIARWTSAHPAAKAQAPTTSLADIPVQTTEAPEAGVEGSWVGYALLGLGVVGVAVALRGRNG